MSMVFQNFGLLPHRSVLRNVEGTVSGWVVPDYVTITKISELNDHRKEFNGHIIGIDAGAGIMKTSEEVIEKYGLDFRLLPSSGPAMTASLKNSVNRHEWIVVTGWRPHWMFGRWDLRFLKQDPDKIVWEEGNIHIMGRKNLKKEKTELAKFLMNMFFTSDQLSDLMVNVEESSDDVEVVARRWMNENPDVIDAWIPK